MTIINYVTAKDLKKVIDDKIINSVNIKYLLKQRGIIPVCLGTTDLSNLVYKIFFGSEFISQMNEQLDTEQNNLKSTVIILKPKDNISSKDYLQDIANEFLTAKQIPNTPYEIDNLCKRKDETGVSLLYSYIKQLKGKIDLIDKRKVCLDVSITPIDDKFKVNIRHEGMSDSKHFIDFLDKMMNNPDSKSCFKLSRIQLDSLTTKNKVAFFDNLGAYKHEDWNLIDITNVTLSRKDNSEFFNSDEDTNLQEVLGGITSAILTGAGLRQNSFVENCMQNDYVFLSMRFKLENKTLPLVLEVDVSFKQKDLKIIIYKACDINEDGKLEKRILTKLEQNEYINYFQDIAYGVYSSLIKSQNIHTTSKQ